MNNFKKRLKKNILIFSTVSIFFLVGIQFVFGAKDLMEQAFEKAAEQEQIIDIGNTKNAVGNEVFRESVGASWKGGEGLKASKKEGLLMNFIRLAIRVSIVIAIPMIIINAIVLIVSNSSGALTNALKLISYITLGIVIILSSMAIVYLILSTTSSTIVPEMQNLK